MRLRGWRACLEFLQHSRSRCAPTVAPCRSPACPPSVPSPSTAAAAWPGASTRKHSTRCAMRDNRSRRCGRPRRRSTSATAMRCRRRLGATRSTPWTSAFHDGDGGSGRVERIDLDTGYDTHEETSTSSSSPTAWPTCTAPRHSGCATRRPGAGGGGRPRVGGGRATTREGDARGYVVYTLRGEKLDHPARDQELVVRDLAWLDADAYRSLVELHRESRSGGSCAMGDGAARRPGTRVPDGTPDAQRARPGGHLVPHRRHSDRTRPARGYDVGG